VKNRFQNLPFKCNLQRYNAGATKEVEAVVRRAPNSADMRAALAALYYSNGRVAEVGLALPGVRLVVTWTILAITWTVPAFINWYFFP
jgi:hypothetical protein